MSQTEFICSKCKQEIIHNSDFTTGYGVNENGEKVCFACCGEVDKAHMIEHGKDTLYLSKKEDHYYVCNWPDTLSFPVKWMWKGRHNMASVAYFVRFIGPDNKIWSGKQIGDNTQICHVKRTKLTSIYA